VQLQEERLSMSVVASVLFEHRLPQHAREAAHTALAIYPLVEINNMTGRQAYMTGDYTRALADWKQALGLAEETDAEAAIRAALVHESLILFTPRG